MPRMAASPGAHFQRWRQGGVEVTSVYGTGEQREADLVIIDGDRGRVIINPDEATLARYRQRLERRRSLSARLAELRDLPAETADGVRILLSANIEFPHETEACLQRGADADLETFGFGAAIVKGHRTREIFVRDGPPVRVPREAGFTRPVADMFRQQFGKHCCSEGKILL